MWSNRAKRTKAPAAHRRGGKAIAIRVNAGGTTQRSPLHALMLWLAVASFAIGIVVRVFAANNNLWFDEVWTLQLLRERVHSFGDVFTNLKHSNNHHLNSLWMWLVGQNASGLVYRLPSVLASIGTIVLAGLIGLRQSRLEGYIAMILTSWSYLLIHFGTEARGYSLAIFFALLAWYALQQFEERHSWIWIIVFWSAVVLGFLAHLEFAICFAGLVAWALWRFASHRPKWRQAVGDLFALFTVPVVLLLVFYIVAIRGMEVGGGPEYQVTPLLIKTASYMLGGPASGAAAGIAALLAVASIYVVLVYLMFERDDRWIFYAVVILVPLGLIAILLPVPLSARYFMISVAASLVLLSSGYAALLRRGIAGRGIGLTLLAVFAAGNAVNTGNLLRFGRGQYLAALLFMERNSDGREVVITSDHDFRNGMLVNYYKRYLERADHTEYVDKTKLDEEDVRTNGVLSGAEWLILHRFDLTKQPERMTDIYGNNYKLVSIYRYSDLSGWNWLLYHNLNRPPVVPHSPLAH
jgi:MFS family permease